MVADRRDNGGDALAPDAVAAASTTTTTPPAKAVSVVEMDVEPGPPAETKTMGWHVRIVCLAIIGVLGFQSICPAESYLHEYLQVSKRIDKMQMHQNIWPMYSYAHFAALIPLTIAAERYCSYPPIITLSILLRLASSLIHELSPDTLIWPHQLSLALFGVSCAGKVALRSFTYSVLPAQVYFIMTIYTRVASAASHVLGSLIGWLLKRANATWTVFFRIQQVCLGVALLSFVLGLYFSQRALSRTPKSETGRASIYSHDQVESGRHLLGLLRRAYASPTLALYSAWIIVAGAVFELVMMNATTLFHDIDRSAKENGLAFGAGKLIASTLTLCLNRYSVMMERNGFLILPVMSWMASAALLASYMATNITVAYVALIFTCISYDLCFCISMTLIASRVMTSVRGVVIFCNTVVSLGIQSAIQAILRLLRFNIHQYFLTLTFVFVAISICLHIGQYATRRRPVSLN